MPIILISVDSKNKNLDDFKSMTDLVVDVLLESTDSRSTAIGDQLANSICFVNRIAIDRLNDRKDSESDDDVMIRIKAAVTMIRQMKVRNGIIISHHSVLNSWSETIIKDEWDVIAM
jgi:hypothetical protein